MFQLHQRTRRQLCLLAFLAVCIAPTLAVAGWCIAARWPGRVEAEARRLSRQLGLAVAVGDVVPLRPGATRYERVTLTDPETGEKLLSCPALEIRVGETKDNQGSSRPTVLLIASQPEIAAAGLSRLWQAPAAILAAAPGVADYDLSLTADVLTLRTADKSHALSNVQGNLGSLQGGAQAQLVFRVAGLEMPEPARVRIVRNRQTMPPATGFELDTGGNALPCELLGLALSELAAFGGKTRFRGYLWANQAAEGWKGEMLGQLFDVDLGRLVSQRFPHRMTGVGQVSIQSARFENGRIEEAAGTLSVGPGELSRSLFDAAVNHLKLPRSAPPPNAAMIPYEQLAFSVLVDKHGLKLQGLCDCGAPGIILADGRNRLLSEPMLQPQSITALIQTLAPPTEATVPASRETQWLLERLPTQQAPLGAGRVLTPPPK